MDLELVVPNAWSVIHHVCSVTETPQRIALSAILERITIAKIIAVELVMEVAITFRGQIVINATRVVWLVMDHPQQIALLAPRVCTITVKIILASLAMSMAFTFRERIVINVTRVV